jgi:hypothetical protein
MDYIIKKEDFKKMFNACNRGLADEIKKNYPAYFKPKYRIVGLYPDMNSMDFVYIGPFTIVDSEDAWYVVPDEKEICISKFVKADASEYIIEENQKENIEIRNFIKKTK